MVSFYRNTAAYFLIGGLFFLVTPTSVFAGLTAQSTSATSAQSATVVVQIDGITKENIAANKLPYSVAYSLRRAGVHPEALTEGFAQTQTDNTTFRVQTDSPESADRLIAQLQNNIGVAVAEPEYRAEAARVPNDTNYNLQWGLHNTGQDGGTTGVDINAEAAWNTTVGATNVVIAVIDSGVDATNPDLIGKVDSGYNFVDNNTITEPVVESNNDGISHGTHVAGTIGANSNNAKGITGVAWQSRIMPIKVLDSAGTGNTTDVANGIDWAVDHGADVINLSLITSGDSSLLREAVARAIDHGVVVVAAAGNSNTNLSLSARYPVCYSGVIGVGAIDNTGAKASFSNYGSCVDVSAPGVNIYSTLFQNGTGFTTDYGYLSGTSFSAGFVSGLAALIKSRNTSASAQDIAHELISEARTLGSGAPHQVQATSSVTYQYTIFSGMGSSGGDARLHKAPAQLLTTLRNPAAHGIDVAVGDVDGDGTDEYVLAYGKGSEPRVEIYERNGIKKSGGFLAFEKSYRGGVRVSVGKVRSGDTKEAIVVSRATGKSDVRIFMYTNSGGRMIGAFRPFGSSVNGADIALADKSADGTKEIYAAAGSGAPYVVAYTWNGRRVRAPFLVFPTSVVGGLEITAGNIDQDAQDELIIGLRAGNSTIRTFTPSGTREKTTIQAFDIHYRGGVHVGATDIDNDGKDDILVGTGAGILAEVRAYKGSNGTKLVTYKPFGTVNTVGVFPEGAH